MAPYPEEIDVFSLPHSRMKELVDIYRKKLLYTDFKDYTALKSLLQSLHHTFCEFKSHEQIENKYIMRKLKKRLKLLSIHDATVCNCHSDNKLSEMLALVEDGYSCTSKTEADRIDFGNKLQQALQEFTGSFLPHMKEEEEVFQPMLMKYFGYEELKCLKQQVIKEHNKWHSYDILTDGLAASDISKLPREVMDHILSFLTPKDLLSCSKVCRKWYDLSREPALWKELYPCFWAHDIWGNYEESHEDRIEKFYPSTEEYVENESSVRQEKVFQAIVDNLLPRIGVGVQKLVVSSAKGLTNALLQSFLKLCPNLTYLDVSYTEISDSAFKGLKEFSCCTKLHHLDLSGCRNVTDLSLFRLADCMALLPPNVPDVSHHLRNLYLEDCHRYQNSCLYEIENSSWSISNDFCNSSCCWQKDGFMCHLAKLSSHCPYFNRQKQQPGVSSIRKTTATVLPTGSLAVPPSLKYLSLSGCSEITDDGLKCLESAGIITKLEWLDVSGCWLMTGEGLSDIVDGLNYLKPENLFYCDHIMDGPHPDTSNGCQNLETGLRDCCQLLQ